MNITPSFRNRPQTGAPASQGRATRARAAGRFDGLSPAPVTLARSRDQTLTFRSIPRHDPPLRHEISCAARHPISVHQFSKNPCSFCESLSRALVQSWRNMGTFRALAGHRRCAPIVGAHFCWRPSMMNFQKLLHPPSPGTEENRYIVGPAVLHQRRQMGRDPNEQVTRVVDACPVGPGGDDAAKTYVRSVQIGSTINPAATAP